MTYKIAGTVKYPFGVISPSEPNNLALGYLTKEKAQTHATAMNELLDQYPVGWNIEYWKTKPEPWVVITVDV
jgi:hypothetical protein